MCVLVEGYVGLTNYRSKRQAVCLESQKLLSLLKAKGKGKERIPLIDKQHRNDKMQQRSRNNKSETSTIVKL
jgi:hypothetical protein